MLHGDMIFALAHLYKNPAYRRMLHSCKKKGKYIIMDNGSAEDSMVKTPELIDICRDLCPDEVIAPDVFFDRNETLSHLETFVDELDYTGLLGRIKIQAVPQGNTREEWLDCYSKMTNAEEVDVIGFSKRVVTWCFLGFKDDQGIASGRHAAVEYLELNKMMKKPIHMLGAGDPREFAFYLHNPYVRSNDSSNTIWASMNGIDFSKGDFRRIKTSKDYFERNLTSDELELAISNIIWVEKHSQ
jgi:hypothetical protein